MLIKFDEIPDGFEKIIFDTNTDNWEDVEISLANNGSHCFMNKKRQKDNYNRSF